MSLFTFSKDDLAVEHEGQTIVLLPKEFALLSFLYENRGRSFTREELLDRVWPLEEPVDRTVDDHIYRIRKKLQPWSSVLTVDTIRNHGYRLMQHEEKRVEEPSLHDKEFHAQVQKMVAKYHLFGQGKALRMLQEQQSVLGVEIDSFYAVYIRFISGDIPWLIDTQEVPFGQKAYLLFCLYYIISDDAEKALELHQRILSSGILATDLQWELEHLDRAFLCLHAGRYEEAMAVLDETLTILKAESIHGFHLAVLNAQLYAYLLSGRKDQAKTTIAEISGRIEHSPYLRERGTFTVANGIYELAHGDKRLGKTKVLEGIDIYRQSGFVPQFFHVVRQLKETLEALNIGEDLRKTCEALQQEFARQYDFPLLQKKLLQLLESHLL